MSKRTEEWAPDRIRELREARGLSRDELGKIIGVTRNTIHTWEAGKHTPTIDRLFVLARALGSRPSYFFKEVTQ